jgi:predicted amidohydrolase
MSICIAAAQSPSVPGDIAANVRTHLAFIEAAHKAGAQLLMFPELSLTGYELPLLRELSMTPDDARLAPIRAAAMAAGMTVIAGAPTLDAGAALPCIASFEFRPDGSTTIYRKQYVHSSEQAHAQSGPLGAHCGTLSQHTYAQAICFDLKHQEHASAAKAAGASLYLASVLVSKNGYADDAGKLQQWAQEFKVGTLLANHATPSGGYDTAGRSAFWAPGGALVAQTEGPGSCLLVVRDEGGWQGQAAAV